MIVSADMAEMALACVAELDGPSLASVVVLDNAFGGGPADGEPVDGQKADARARLAQQAQVVPLDVPHGFAAANNLGIAQGRAPYVLLLNSDVLVTAGAIETLLAALRGQPAPSPPAAPGRSGHARHEEQVPPAAVPLARQLPRDRARHRGALARQPRHPSLPRRAAQ